MNCRRVDDLLSDQLEGLLSPRQTQAVAAHLDHCPACRHRREQLRAIGPDLRELAELRTPPGLFPRAMERWAEQATDRGNLHDAGRASLSRAGCGAWTWRGRSIAMAPVGLAAVGIASLLWGPLRPLRPAATEMAASPALGARGGIQRVSPRASSPGDGSRHEPAGQGRGPEATAANPPREGQTISRRLAWLRQPPTPFATIGRDALRASRPPKRFVRDDLSVLNDSLVRDARTQDAVPPEEWQTLMDRVRPRAKVGDDFVQVPYPRLASTSERQIAGALEQYQREVAVVDTRLAREVTVQQKATALADLCERLRADTGIPLGAGQSVADEKVTIFCRKLPLREVMRQLSRPFGYTWLRSGKTGEYRYELVQDLRSQLLEEELRNRARNAALLALEREIERYRPYLGLSPDDAAARARTAPAADKPLLENLAGYESGAIRMYYRLSPAQLAALRAGQKLTFSQEPQPGEQLLPPDMARGVLQSIRDWHVRRDEAGFSVEYDPKKATEGLSPAAVPEARATVILWIDHSELGQFTLAGGSGFRLSDRGGNATTRAGLAVGASPNVQDPQNAAANARLAADPALRPRITVLPQPSCGSDPFLGGGRSTPGRSSGRHAGGGGRPADTPALPGKGEQLPLPASGRGPGGEVNPPKVTSADVLEALHRASGLPIVADAYTRLYPPGAVSVRNVPLFDALNRLADAMQMRWEKARDGDWLEFRSTSYYDDRVKEIPNRLLTRWAASRRQHGALTLEDLAEIGQLSDAQLDSETTMAGAKACFGLAEWDLAHYEMQRPHLRYLASLTPAQRQTAQSPAGLPFARMSLAQQQQFIALGLSSQSDRAPSLVELREATLRVEYTQPGAFEWSRFPVSGRASIPQVALLGRDGRAPSPVRERTPEAALLAARRLDPQADATQIVPTELALSVLYTWGDSRTGFTTFFVRATPDETGHATLHSPQDRAGDPSPDLR